MGILDDFKLGDDPLEPKKKEDPFKINFDLGGYGKALADSLVGSAGGDGGALPGNIADVPKVSAIEPVMPLKTDIEKPVVKPAISPVKTEPAKTYADIKAESQSRMDRAISALNSLVKPEQQQSEDVGTLGLEIAQKGNFNPGEMAQQVNRISDVEREESANTGTLGIKFEKEGRFSPEALDDALNQTGKSELQETGQIARLDSSVSQEARYEYQPNIAEPGYFLAKARSLKNRQKMGQTLAGLLNNYSDATYGAVSDQAQGMAGWNNAKFDPSAINQYGAWERRQARDFVTASLEGGKQIKYDPEMAKMQAFPILDRFNRYHGYDAMGNSGFASASFSMDTLKDQLHEHMVKGTDLNYGHMEQTARAMASLEKTGYGEKVKNIMGSVYTGSLTIGQETSHTLMTMLQGYPPAEVIAFDLQTNYLANGNDLAGWASEIEANRRYARQNTRKVYGAWEEAKNMTRSIRSDTYNELQYFTADPTRSALLRPDKLTGDFFEKAIPMMVSLTLPTRGASAANFSKIGTLFTQFTWIGSQAFNNGAAERIHTLMNNPHMVDNNPQFHEFRRNSPLSYEDARATFIEAEGRRAGVQSGLISLATAGTSFYLKNATSTGTEGPVMEFMQNMILSMMSNATDEAINTPHDRFINEAEEGGKRKGY